MQHRSSKPQAYSHSCSSSSLSFILTFSLILLLLTLFSLLPARNLLLSASLSPYSHTFLLLLFLSIMHLARGFLLPSTHIYNTHSASISRDNDDRNDHYSSIGACNVLFSAHAPKRTRVYIPALRGEQLSLNGFPSNRIGSAGVCRRGRDDLLVFCEPLLLWYVLFCNGWF